MSYPTTRELPSRRDLSGVPGSRSGRPGIKFPSHEGVETDLLVLRPRRLPRDQEILLAGPNRTSRDRTGGTRKAPPGRSGPGVGAPKVLLTPSDSLSLCLPLPLSHYWGLLVVGSPRDLVTPSGHTSLPTTVNSGQRLRWTKEMESVGSSRGKWNYRGSRTDHHTCGGTTTGEESG